MQCKSKLNVACVEDGQTIIFEAMQCRLQLACSDQALDSSWVYQVAKAHNFRVDRA